LTASSMLTPSSAATRAFTLALSSASGLEHFLDVFLVDWLLRGVQEQCCVYVFHFFITSPKTIS
jgi:hypothetical protein